MIRAWVAGIWKEDSSEADRGSDLSDKKKTEWFLKVTHPPCSDFLLLPAVVGVTFSSCLRPLYQWSQAIREGIQIQKNKQGMCSQQLAQDKGFVGTIPHMERMDIWSQQWEV